MFFSIDTNDAVAIYEQIVRQVKFAVAEGSLQPTQLLPSARQLSAELAINPNTVAKAYQQLQAAGILELLRGRGVVVTQKAPSMCRDARRVLITARLRQTLTEALHSGIAADDLRQMLSDQVNELEGSIATIASSPANHFSKPDNHGGAR